MDADDLSPYLEALPLPVLLVTFGGRVGAMNARAATLLGAGKGRHYITVLRQPAVLDAIERTLDTGEVAQARFLANEAKRETTWQATAAPVPAGVMVSFEDVSAMQEAGQMRRDFVANVSHELRTPLTALLGFIETLRGAARDDAAARDRFLGIMEHEATRMNRLVRDLLSLSRVEAEERVRPATGVDLGPLLQSVLHALEPLAEEAGVRFEREGVREGLVVPGDADQLRQVFTNLIENALKYGGSGGVVGVEMTEDVRDPSLRRPAVRVAVWDRGDGMDPLHIPRVTERFYRVDSHRSREMGGTGLGLAIVKHIVNRHRGRLRVESALGQGSRFSVILPRT